GSLQQLEQIVHDLERGDIGLDQALSHYERGVALLRHCYGLLRRAEHQIALLTGLDEEGNPVTAPFDATATIERLACGSGSAADEATCDGPPAAARRRPPGSDGDPTPPAGRHRGQRKPAVGLLDSNSPGVANPKPPLLF